MFGRRPCPINGDEMAKLPQLGNLVGVFNQKALNEKGRIHPRAVDFRNEHADLKFGYRDF